jgi:hypothetical protein
MAALQGVNVKAAAISPAEFDAMYDDVAAYLMNPANHPDLKRGIVEIEYGDAKAYFPQWVYTLEELPGYSATTEQKAIAGEMIGRYQESFDKVEANPFRAFGDMNLLMDAAIGIEGMLRTYEHDPSPDLRDLARRYLDFAKIIGRRPRLIMSYHVEPYGPTTVIAGAAWFYLYYADVMGPDDPRYEEFKEIGLDIIRKMDKRLYSEQGKKYLYSIRRGYDFTYAYNNTVMVQALIRAYLVTGERRYSDRAIEIMGTIERELYFPEYGGYLAAENPGLHRSRGYTRKYEKIGPQYNREYMALSTHNYMIYAYLALYEAGGFEDEELLEKAVICLRFIRDHLWDHEGKIQHHLEFGEISPPADYCTGCNFQTLFHIVQYKALLDKEPVMGLYKK